MIPPYPRLQVNVAEQLARSIVAASHVPSPNLVGANESRSTARGQPPFFNNLLEDENAKLKKLLAEAMLDNAMLKDVASKKW
jgi:hypothetical protein